MLDEDEQVKPEDANKKIRMYFTPDDPVFQTVRDFTLDDTRHFLSDKIKKFQDLADNLAKTNDRDLLAKAAKEKKYIKKYKEHLTLAMHVQQNLQMPVNFKLFEYEQVRSKQASLVISSCVLPTSHRAKKL